jgi:transposase-like protein
VIFAAAGDGRGMRRYSESERRQIVRDFERSGLSAVEFCRRRGVSTVTLGQWRKRFAGGARAAERAGASWLPVVITGGEGVPSPAKRCAYVMSVGDWRLEVPAGFDPGEVRQLWQVLAGSAGDPLRVLRP